MGTIQVDEAQHASLTEAAGRVPELEQKLDQANARGDVAERKLLERDNRDAATAVIAKEAKDAGVVFTALESKGLLAEMPIGDDGKVDETKLTEAVQKAAADKAAESGAGSITGFGRSTDTSSTDVVAEARAAAGSAFGRTPTKIGA